MIMAAYNGLPLSLKGVGNALNLDEQKMSEGKDLIRYFCVPCKPTKVNGGRTRNLPEHAADKWELFKAYNIRDVEVEQGIVRRLSKYPVPDFVWEEYFQSERINDRGIEVDTRFLDGCLYIDDTSKNKMLERMKEITGLDNPNSVVQLTEWLKHSGVEVNGLDKKSVNLLINSTGGFVKEALILRSRLSKTSIKKYEAMDNSIGENTFGGESVTYMFTDVANKWTRVESYGPKFIENIVQGISRDILCFAMKNLENYRICAHVHDECIIECQKDETVEHICELMSKTPD